MDKVDSTFLHIFPQETGGSLNVALYEPEIPLNTGSVARTCACTGTPLHIVGTPGFRLDNRLAKRAGLDYWEHAEVHIHLTWGAFMEEVAGRKIWLFSTKGGRPYWEGEYGRGDVLVFGSERTGLPAEILESGEGEVVRIPMLEGRRSLNLSNTVAIALYEALRQQVIEVKGENPEKP